MIARAAFAITAILAVGAGISLPSPARSAIAPPWAKFVATGAIKVMWLDAQRILVVRRPEKTSFNPLKAVFFWPENYRFEIIDARNPGKAAVSMTVRMLNTEVVCARDGAVSYERDLQFALIRDWRRTIFRVGPIGHEKRLVVYIDGPEADGSTLDWRWCIPRRIPRSDSGYSRALLPGHGFLHFGLYPANVFNIDGWKYLRELDDIAPLTLPFEHSRLDVVDWYPWQMAYRLYYPEGKERPDADRCRDRDWWLYPGGTVERICLPEDRTGGFEPFRDGFILGSVGRSEGFEYLFVLGGSYLSGMGKTVRFLDSGRTIAQISPDGCKILLAFGDEPLSRMHYLADLCERLRDGRAE
ncbi:MAG: hypothetical protein KIT16_21475 [Rhodospirillaceae bacterium]|nr:hypothetical protein [Rhodospirillaceae bacterium]